MYKRLCIEEREEIAKGLAQEKSFREIAKKLKRSPSTISREINRLLQNRHTYSLTISNTDAYDKQKRKTLGKRKITGVLQKLIEHFLEKRWSPEQISHHLKITYSEHCKQISHEAIYQYIYLQEGEKRKRLSTHLRQRKKRRGRRNSAYEKRGKIKKATSIHERPKEVEERSIFGHWEGDLIVGKDHKTAIGTLGTVKK